MEPHRPALNRHLLVAIALPALGLALAAASTALPWLRIRIQDGGPEPQTVSLTFYDIGVVYGVGVIALPVLVGAAAVLAGRQCLAMRLAATGMAGFLLAAVAGLANYQVSWVPPGGQTSVERQPGMLLAIAALLALGVSAWTVRLPDASRDEPPPSPAAAEEGPAGTIEVNAEPVSPHWDLIEHA